MSLHKAWYVGVALAALGRRSAAQRTHSFGRADLEGLCPDFKRRRTTTTAIDHLRGLGFLAVSDEHQRPGQPRYMLTVEGLEAAKAAATTLDRAQRAAASPFAQRLWNLLRARSVLTSVEAANLLTDAGDNVEQARSAAAELLRGWAAARPDAVQIGARRVEGAKRYVLVVDVGPRPPVGSLPRTAA